VERQLLPERLAGAVAREGLGERPEAVLGVVVEAPHPLVGPEVVVEGAVLLHEEDHVLDGAEVRPGRDGGLRPGDGGRRATAGSQGPGAHGQRPPEESPAVERRRGPPVPPALLQDRSPRTGGRVATRRWTLGALSE